MKRLDQYAREGQNVPIPAYTWATLPISARRYSYALVADTLAGDAGTWLFEFRDDLNASYPWRIVGGNTAARAVKIIIGNASSGANYNIGSFTFGAAGSYVVTTGHGGTSASTQLAVGTTSAGGTPNNIVDWDTAIQWTSGKSATYTATNGQTAYINGSAAGGNSVPFAYVSVRPVRVAGQAV